MTEEKKLIPHIKRREACHPGKDLKLIHIFEKVPDPRGPSCNIKHPSSGYLNQLLFQPPWVKFSIHCLSRYVLIFITRL